jgi:uncharacterized protein
VTNYLLMMVRVMGNSIFQQQLFLGFVNKVTTKMVTTHIPSSRYLEKFYNNGEEFHGGLINSFVIIEGENWGFLGKVISAEIPDKERVEITSEALKQKDFHPLIKIEILSMFDYLSITFNRSIYEYPNVGSKVFIARRKIIDRYIKQIELKYTPLRTKEFALLLSNHQAKVDFSLQALFSRHTAIVGTTGSGKSWTTCNLVENLIENNQKAVLIDATGEYRSLVDVCSDRAINVSIGENHHFSYKRLTIDDLFYLVKPSPNTQLPKLREAIKSLKLIATGGAEELTNYIEELYNGIRILKKKNKPKEPFMQILNQNLNIVSEDNLNFDVRSLAIQIENECIWESAHNNPTVFGGTDNNSLGYCTTLITRVNHLLSESQFDKVFNFSGENKTVDAYNLLDQFVTQHTHNLFYIDLSELPFAFNIREVVANSIGKTMLSYAREDKFKTKPIVLFLDEAHQFVNKSVSNDFESFKLEAFDNIAKEGRKYGLFLCMTTQLPRDIPVGTLSQIGTFIVHRLINHRDKEIVINAMPSVNSEIANYLSDLGQGEVILSSTEIKTPLLLKVNEPDVEPDSKTPEFN